MADSINLDLGYFDHIKTVRLASALGRGAEMLPVKLWCYCGMHPNDNGTLTDFSADDVEAVILKWWGKPGQAVEAMVKVGFLDFDGKTYTVHGWSEKNGHVIAFHQRAVNAANARWGKLRGSKCPSISPSNATSITKQCPTDRPTDLPTVRPTKSKEKEEKQVPAASPLADNSPPPNGNGHSPPKTLTNVQRVVRGFKAMMDVDLTDAGWDSVYFSRYSKSAKALLTLFSGDMDKIAACMEGVVGELTKRKLSWTPETVVKHASDWREGRLLK